MWSSACILVISINRPDTGIINDVINSRLRLNESNSYQFSSVRQQSSHLVCECLGSLLKTGTLPLERSLFADFKLIVEDADPLSDPHSPIFRSSARLQKGQ